MPKFVIRNGEQIRTTIAPIATGTAIEYGDLVTISSGLIIKAVAASTTVALCTKAHPANSGTQIEVSVGNDFTMRGTMDVFSLMRIEVSSMTLTIRLRLLTKVERLIKFLRFQYLKTRE
jgi:hypothetical protein